MSSRLFLKAVSAAVAVLALVGGPVLADGIPASALLPDTATVIPTQVQLVNAQQREVIRFSNGVANIGEGPWRMRPIFPLDGSTLEPQLAIQELLDAGGNVAHEAVVSQFEYHPTHNHWHINGIALFEFRTSRNTGTIDGDDIGDVYVNDRGESQSLKTTFCLIDWVKLIGNSNNGAKSDRVYFDCAGAYQGISPGWVDQYHQATDGQEVDVTGAPAGLYYLLSTANHEYVFVESDYTNNFAWVAIRLTRESNGNPKIKIVGDSLVDGAGVPPLYTENR